MRDKNRLMWQEGSAVLVIVLLSSIFLLEPSLSIARSGTAAWLVKVLGGIVFLGVAVAIEKLYRQHCREQKSVCSFASFVSSCVGITMQKVMWTIWAALVVAELVFMFRIVAESMAKIALLQEEILFPLVLFGGGTILALQRQWYAILRAGYLLSVIALLLVILLIVLVAPLWETELVLPWQGFGYRESVSQIGAEVGSWCMGSVVFLLFPLMQEGTSRRQTLWRGVMSVLGLKGAFLLAMLGIFGSVVGAERSFLFYEAAKLVHFSQYIQRVEGIFICAWVMVVFLAMVILLRSLLILAGDLLDVTDTRPLTGLVVVTVVIGAALVEDSASVVQWSEYLVYTMTPLVFAIGSVLLAGGSVWRKRGER